MRLKVTCPLESAIYRSAVRTVCSCSKLALGFQNIWFYSSFPSFIRFLSYSESCTAWVGFNLVLTSHGFIRNLGEGGAMVAFNQAPLCDVVPSGGLCCITRNLITVTARHSKYTHSFFSWSKAILVCIEWHLWQLIERCVLITPGTFLRMWVSEGILSSKACASPTKSLGEKNGNKERKDLVSRWVSVTRIGHCNWTSGCQISWKSASPFSCLFLLIFHFLTSFLHCFV
jgi:hypothetical protein